MTSSVTSPIESPRPLSYRLPIVTFLLAPSVSEIFDLKVADTQTNKQNSTLTDNKGPLKLALANQHTKATDRDKKNVQAQNALSYKPKSPGPIHP